MVRVAASKVAPASRKGGSMRRRLLSVAVGALVALTVVFSAAAGDGPRDKGGSANRLTLAVIGDTPYGDEQLASFPALVESINEDPKVRLAVHLGDIKSGSTRCDDSYFATIAEHFSDLRDPLVYTPGDNEWTDCHRPNNGS
jgi:hypothetical protein